MRRIASAVMMCGLVIAGCGSSGGVAATGGSGGHGGGGGGAGGGACQPFIPGDGTITWDADGAAVCATATSAIRMTSSGLDFIEIVGATFGTAASTGIALSVSAFSAPLGGTYSCKGDAATTSNVILVYTPDSKAGTVQDCTITFDSAGAAGGAHATGSFSATVTVNGATVSVTNGKFDTPITVTGG